MTPLTLIIGGAASGKSLYAEQIVNFADRPKVYVATAQAFDAEMQGKIAAHRAQRGNNWHTIEAPLDAPNVITQAPADHVVLLDCLTLWLTNTLLAERDLDAEIEAMVSALKDSPAPIVVVSNEVGQGIVPDNALSRRFRNAQGQLNRLVAQQADSVIAVMAGLPLALKGRLP